MPGQVARAKSREIWPAGQIRDDVAFQHLLNQVERIHDLANLRDAAVTKGIESRDIELHDPVVAALAEEHPDIRRDPVALGDEESALRSACWNSGLDGLPHRPEFVLAAVVAHMRQDIDRRVGEEIDIIGAAGQRALDIAGIENFEKIQHALPMKIVNHFLLRRCWARLALQAHSEPNCTGINRQNDQSHLVSRD